MLAEIVPITSKTVREPQPAVLLDAGEHPVLNSSSIGHGPAGNYPTSRLILSIPADELEELRTVLRSAPPGAVMLEALP